MGKFAGFLLHVLMEKKFSYWLDCLEIRCPMVVIYTSLVNVSRDALKRSLTSSQRSKRRTQFIVYIWICKTHIVT